VDVTNPLPNGRGLVVVIKKSGLRRLLLAMTKGGEIASSLALLAMTKGDEIASAPECLAMTKEVVIAVS